MSASDGFSRRERPMNYLLQWTEKARIQLIEGVIDVEEQMITRASTSSRCTTGKRMVNTRFEYKWSTVANLLPVEYRGKIWNEKKQMHYKYKCERMFNSLLHAYREKVAGKSTQAARWEMSEPVLKLLKKREDLVIQRCSAMAERSFRSEISTSVNALNDHSPPSSSMSRYTAAKPWKKRKQALLVDIYAKETQKNHVHQEKTVEKCNAGFYLHSASEDPANQVHL